MLTATAYRFHSAMICLVGWCISGSKPASQSADPRILSESEFTDGE